MVCAVFAAFGGCSSDTDETASPVIRSDQPAAVAAAGGLCEIGYTIDNAAPDARVRVSCDPAWLRESDASAVGIVCLVVDANSDPQIRTGRVELSYPGASTVKLTVTQQAAGEAAAFRITCSDPGTSSISVEWAPEEGVGSYFSMVTEKVYFDRFPDEESYIADDMDYVRERAELYEKSFDEMLATYLNTGKRTSRIEGLKPDTEYYAYAYGLTAQAEPTTAIVKTLFRTQSVKPVDCTFTFGVTDKNSFGATVAVKPSDKLCTYFWDCVPKATLDELGSPDKVIATNIDYIYKAVEIMQMAGYDYTFSNFLTTDDDRTTLKELTPDTEYVAFAFGLDVSGVATTELSTSVFRTDAFVATDDCTFGVGFEQVETARMNVVVTPSNQETRYYVGICDASNLKRYTPDELAALLIAQENRNGLDWGSSGYIFSGTRSIDTSEDLDLDDLSADTEYAAVVFGVDPAGVRTTVVAHAVQRTAKAVQSLMTIDITVTNVTSLGAFVVFRPSVDDETYFTDCIDYETYAEYGGDDEAFVRAQVAKLGGNIGAYLTLGYHTLDADGFLEPQTEYIAYAFGYNDGVTTPLMKSEKFVTAAMATDSRAEVTVGTEIRNGDDFYAEDPVKYATYRGKAVVFARLTPNEYAVHWYAGAFKDISGYSDEQMIPMLKVQGRKDAAELGNLAEWGSELTYAVVAMDEQGAYGRLVRKKVLADRASVVSGVSYRSVAAETVAGLRDLPGKSAPEATIRTVRKPRRTLPGFENVPHPGLRLSSPEVLAEQGKAVRRVRFR